MRLLAVFALAAVFADSAFAGAGHYTLSATQSCLAKGGLAVSVESPVPASLRKLTPYGTQGGLIWKESGNEGIYIEFGKTPAEAAAMRAAVIKLFGKSAGGAATVAKGNVMFYTNHFKLTGHETSTVLRCLH